MEEIIDRFDDAISARIEEYDQYFFEKLEEFVATQGLVSSNEASGVQPCPAVYFPTHPGVTPTKNYEFGLQVSLNSPVSGPQLIREDTELRGDEGLPTIAQLDERKLTPALMQNLPRAGTTNSNSSYCVLPARPRRLPSHGRHFVTDCRHTYKYASALMRDTYTDLDGNYFRGYWIVEPHLDPSHPSLFR